MGQIANSRSRSSAALCESANRATASPSEGCSATSAAISSAREAAVEQSPLPATMGLKARPKAQPATPTRMITGAQIKAARLLLGWGPSKLAQRAKLPSAVIHRAESVDGEPPITLYQAALIRNGAGAVRCRVHVRRLAGSEAEREVTPLEPRCASPPHCAQLAGRIDTVPMLMPGREASRAADS